MVNKALFLSVVFMICTPFSVQARNVEVNWEALDTPAPVAPQKAIPAASQPHFVPAKNTVRAQDSLEYLKDKYFPEGYSYRDTVPAASKAKPIKAKPVPAPVVAVHRDIPAPVVRPAYEVAAQVVEVSEPVIPVIPVIVDTPPVLAEPPPALAETVVAPDASVLVDASAAELPPVVISEPVVDLTSGGATSFVSDDRGLLVKSFEFGRDDIRISDSDKALLNAQTIGVLEEHSDARVSIYAYANSDGRGKKKARRLSLSRALEFRSLLVTGGVSSAQIDIFPLGDAEDGTQNERIDLILQK